MKKALLAIAALVQMTWAVPSHALTAHCSYWNERSDVLLDGQCRVEETDSGGNFSYRIRFEKGESVTIEYIKSQSGHHIWKINGVLGWGYEINRCHLAGADNDLHQILDIAFDDCD